MYILEVLGLSVNFGGLWALKEVDIQVQPRQVCSVIGPNGAGKTTLFNTITGAIPPSQGKILFQGRRISGLKPFQVAHRGIARTFQNIRLFSSLTVQENLLLPYASRMGLGAKFHFSKFLSAINRENRIQCQVQETLKNFGLEDLREQKAMNLSQGHQRKLEIARAMILGPQIILLDEFSAGLSKEETKEILILIQGIKERGTTILLIEHNMAVVMNISEKIYVLNYGIKIAEGPPDEIRKNPKVIEAYLGGA